MFKYKNKGGKKMLNWYFISQKKRKIKLLLLKFKGKPFIYDIDLKIGHKFLENIPKKNKPKKVIGISR